MACEQSDRKKSPYIYEERKGKKSSNTKIIAYTFFYGDALALFFSDLDATQLVYEKLADVAPIDADIPSTDRTLHLQFVVRKANKRGTIDWNSEIQ